MGFITEDDVKGLNKQEKAIVDKIIDHGPCPAGQLNQQDIRSLYLQVRALWPDVETVEFMFSLYSLFVRFNKKIICKQ